MQQALSLLIIILSGMMHSFLLAGLDRWSTPAKSTNISSPKTWDVKENLKMENMTTLVHNDTSVSYEYHLRNFEGSPATPVASNRSIVSTTKCTQLIQHDSYNQTYLDEESSGGVFYTSNFPLNEDVIGCGGATFIFQKTVNLLDKYPNQSRGPLGPFDYITIDVTLNTCGPRCNEFCKAQCLHIPVILLIDN